MMSMGMARFKHSNSTMQSVTLKSQMTGCCCWWWVLMMNSSFAKTKIATSQWLIKWSCQWDMIQWANWCSTHQASQCSFSFLALVMWKFTNSSTELNWRWFKGLVILMNLECFSPTICSFWVWFLILKSCFSKKAKMSLKSVWNSSRIQRYGHLLSAMIINTS